MPTTSPLKAAQQPARIRLKTHTKPQPQSERKVPRLHLTAQATLPGEDSVEPVKIVTGVGGFLPTNVPHPSTVTPANAAKWGKKNMNLAKCAKTRVGNRQQMVRGVDERDWRVRRAKELYFGMVLDMGGHDNISTLQDKLAKDLAFLIVMGEELCDGWINGREDFAPFLYIGYIKTAYQLARQLGLKRVAREINPKGKAKPVKTLDEFITQQERQKPNEVDSGSEATPEDEN